MATRRASVLESVRRFTAIFRIAMLNMPTKSRSACYSMLVSIRGGLRGFIFLFRLDCDL